MHLNQTVIWERHIIKSWLGDHIEISILKTVCGEILEEHITMSFG